LHRAEQHAGKGGTPSPDSEGVSHTLDRYVHILVFELNDDRSSVAFSDQPTGQF